MILILDPLIIYLLGKERDVNISPVILSSHLLVRNILQIFQTSLSQCLIQDYSNSFRDNYIFINVAI